jgi:hypothetical protein
VDGEAPLAAGAGSRAPAAAGAGDSGRTNADAVRETASSACGGDARPAIAPCDTGAYSRSAQATAGVDAIRRPPAAAAFGRVDP